MENNQDRGFTLVELLIVIVILGILATVTVFAVRGITDQGNKNACEIEKKTIETAAEAFYAQEATDAGSIKAIFDAGFLKDDPTDVWTYTPGVGTTSAYVTAADNAKCDLTDA
jgi:prepilin-type N-terminal cleavage/methylation domain-containing protein